jgi:hypothetical protein
MCQCCGIKLWIRWVCFAVCALVLPALLLSSSVAEAASPAKLALTQTIPALMFEAPHPAPSFKPLRVLNQIGFAKGGVGVAMVGKSVALWSRQEASPNNLPLTHQAKLAPSVRISYNSIALALPF